MLRRVPFLCAAVLSAACALETRGTGPAVASDEVTQENEPAPTAIVTPPAAHTFVDCDQDRDGFVAAGFPCFGNDCCDHDATAHPGSDAFSGVPTACGTWDRNCDGKVEPETATGKCNDQIVSCSGEGFEKDTPCGEEGTHFKCGWFFGCTHEQKTSRMQRCR